MRTLKYPKPQPRGRKPRTRISRRGKIKTRSTVRRSKEKYAHSLWVEFVRSKEPSGYCPRCRKRKWSDCAHGWAKGRYPHLRFDPMNGIPLCRVCHRIVDSDHEAKYQLWWRYIGPMEYTRLQLLAISRAKVDLDLAILLLEQLLKDPPDKRWGPFRS